MKKIFSKTDFEKIVARNSLGHYIDTTNYTITDDVPTTDSTTLAFYIEALDKGRAVSGGVIQDVYVSGAGYRVTDRRFGMSVVKGFSVDITIKVKKDTGGDEHRKYSLYAVDGKLAVDEKPIKFNLFDYTVETTQEV
ncbi:hypothetical protein [Vibrio panuliri]|uniref:Uncharacterized protein n=1 Tax=Vibrio panuliri TaxID=1381081 RepID=A0ABX3FIP9_9VIBR|nr:hypothetical protein [Vibrio panuliri]OLQ91633.1 hypothetical protein BIY20_09530 [Vibrio panuliri]